MIPLTDCSYSSHFLLKFFFCFPWIFPT